jgi:hypothetical protein
VVARFHLPRNLNDAFQKILEREHTQLRRAADSASPPAAEPASPTPSLSAAERRKRANRERRWAHRARRRLAVQDTEAKGRQPGQG